MTQQDKKELIQAISKNTASQINKGKQEILEHTTMMVGNSKKEVLGAVENLAMATKKGFDEVHAKFEAMDKRFNGLEEIVTENQERIGNVESAVFRIEHKKPVKVAS